MILKPSVRLHAASPQLAIGLQAADYAYRERGSPVGIYVTSINDGSHKKYSRHGYGYAADGRLITRLHPDYADSWRANLRDQTAGHRHRIVEAELQLHEELKKALGPDWDVLFEGPDKYGYAEDAIGNWHHHIEWDPKR